MKIKIYLAKLGYHLASLLNKKWLKSYPNVDEKLKITENLNYSKIDRKKRILDIYAPKEETNLPVIINIHGGGWTVGDKKDVAGFSKYIASFGYVSVAINYSLAPKYRHPKQEENIVEAVKWINDNISNYGGDPNRIYLAGDSGGAHLAAVVAGICANEEYARMYNLKAPLNISQISGMLLYYGAYDFMTALDSGFPLLDASYHSFLNTMDIVKDEALMKLASPIHNLNEKFPRSLIISSEIDHLHKSQSFAFVEKLKSLNVPYVQLFIPETDTEAAHGFLIDYNRSCTKLSVEKTLEFIK